MDIAKMISRKHLAWQCIYLAKKNFYSAATVQTFSRTSRATTYAQKSNDGKFLQSPLKLWEKSAYISSSAQLNTVEATFSSEKKEQSEPTPPTTETEPHLEENAAKDEREESLEESPRSEALSINKAESGDVERPSEQEETDWENNKLDKLYKVIELEVLSYEPSVLDSYQWFVVTTATHLGIRVGKCWSPLKSDKIRFALLKSAFVHKKHQVQYEVRTYHRFLTFHKLTSSTADTFLEYIQRNLPEGVGLKVTRVEAKTLPDYLQKHAQQQ